MKSLFSRVVTALCFLFASHEVTAFTVLPQTNTVASPTQLEGLLGGLQDAFKNDERLGKPKNAGLKNGPNFNENVTVNGKPVPGAVAGQKLTVVAGKVRVKIPVDCQNGDCGTCRVKLNGRVVKGKQVIDVLQGQPSSDVLTNALLWHPISPLRLFT